MSADRELADVLLAAGDQGGNTHSRTTSINIPLSSHYSCTPAGLSAQLPGTSFSGGEKNVCAGGVFNDGVAGCP